VPVFEAPKGIAGFNRLRRRKNLFQRSASGGAPHAKPFRVGTEHPRLEYDGNAFQVYCDSCKTVSPRLTVSVQRIDEVPDLAGALLTLVFPYDPLE